MTSLTRTIKKLTKEGKLAYKINQYDTDGRTPLICSIVSKRNDRTNPTEIIDTLLNAGADVNVADNFNGMTPIHFAAFASEESLCVALLGKGADVNQCDFRCVTPLMISCQKNLVLLTTILCDRLANLDAVDDNGWTALHHASYSGYPKIVKLLLDYGSDRHIKDNKGVFFHM